MREKYRIPIMNKIKKYQEIIKELPVGSTFGGEEIEAISRVLQSGDSLTRGKDVELFEKEFAKYCNTKYAIAVSSCGAALHIAAQVLNLRPEDEVICQANAFWATFVRLLHRKVKIIVADIEPYSLNIDASKIEPLITNRTKAIYVMHHGGNPADLDVIREIAKKYNLIVVEDAAHAVGAEYKGKKIGSDSDIACFSFSSMKNMSTLGEGGMFVTNNKSFYEMAWGLRTNYPYGKRVKRNVPKLGDYPKPQSPAFMHAGDAWDYDWLQVDEVGMTYRMSTPQAAVGRVQLLKLDKFNLIRSKIAEKYNKAIDDTNGFRKVEILPVSKHSWHLFSFFIRSDKGFNRDEFVRIMENKFKIKIVIRFWPIHLGGIMRLRGHKAGECPVAERIWFKEQLSLPISPQMKEWEIKKIITSIGETMEMLKK